MKIQDFDNMQDGSMDAGLHLLYLATPRGTTRTRQEIADACGCKPQNIEYYEKTAIQKLKTELQKRGITFYDFL